MKFSYEYCEILGDIAIGGKEGCKVCSYHADGTPWTYTCRKGYEMGGGASGDKDDPCSLIFFKSGKIAEKAAQDCRERAEVDGVRCCIERFGRCVWITRDGRDAWDRRN